MRKTSVKNTETACRSEHQEQVLLCFWLDKYHPDLHYFAIPNGGYRNKVTAYKLKQEGVKPGVPDLFFPSLKLFIEMKTEKGVMSASQKEWKHKLESCGYRVEMCRGFEEAKKIIESNKPA